jgi:hypothetical protein
MPWKDLLQRMGHYFRLQMLGVLAPGVVLVMEVAYFSLPSDARAGMFEALRYLSAHSIGLSSGILALAGATLLFVAYIVGFIIRQAVWIVLLRTLLRGSGYDCNWSSLREALSRDYSTQTIDEILAEHPAFLRSDGPTALGARRYAKIWLSQREPRLAVDYLEAEINILFANLIPFAIVPFVAVKWAVKDPTAYLLIASTISAGVIALLLHSGRALLKATEPYETMFNFLMAHWIARCPPRRDDANSRR